MLEVHLLSQLILLSQRLLPTLLTFPQAPGDGSLKDLFPGREWRTVPLADFPPIIHSLPYWASQPAPSARTAQAQRRQAAPRLSGHLLQGNKDPVPLPLASVLGTGPAPSYVSVSS